MASINNISVLIADDENLMRQLLASILRSMGYQNIRFAADGPQAVEAINAPPEFMMGRKLIGERRAVDVEKLANKAVSMKEVAKA